MRMMGISSLLRRCTRSFIAADAAIETSGCHVAAMARMFALAAVAAPAWIAGQMPGNDAVWRSDAATRYHADSGRRDGRPSDSGLPCA